MSQEMNRGNISEVIGRFFGLVGLGHDSIAVYTHLANGGASTDCALAAQCDLAPEQVANAVEELVGAGFVSVSQEQPRQISMLRPDAAIASAITSSETVASAELERLANVRRLAATLNASVSALREQREASSFETLEDSHAAVSRLQELNHDTQHEILAVVPARPSRDALRVARVADAKVLGRGVDVRGIYLQACRNDPATMDYLQWMEDHGARVRLAVTLPARIQIFDRKVAVVAESVASKGPGAIVVHSDGVVNALLRLFEYAWDAAESPFDAGQTAPDLSAQQREILWWLARGAKDDAVAREMGVSARTVRRTLSELAGELGAASRFELAVKCAQRGWLGGATASQAEGPLSG